MTHVKPLGILLKSLVPWWTAWRGLGPGRLDVKTARRWHAHLGSPLSTGCVFSEGTLKMVVFFVFPFKVTKNRYPQAKTHLILSVQMK